ncbi:piggyBac transposable element-derived protein 3-like [Ischnura elegans]|uniref:piggyBac transposable element-derived protein 3-like n=1 Tax=Ischnura elegans TaxID=197161 RepID=UPI001ED8737A|nr:piggyBac transposable element-derived protein 3-like [Ischnura elegans]
MQILEDDNIDFDEIYIEPPVVTELSDEDSADEDSGGKVDNLSGRQLRANAEVVVRKSGQESGMSQEICEDVQECSVAGPSRKAPKRCKKGEQEAVWDDGDITVHDRIFPNPDYSMFREASPTTIFELFFDEEVIAHLVQESNKYAQFCNCNNPNIIPEELKVFVAILFLSGYNTVPSKRHYWEATQDTRNELVYNSMRRDRFLQINRFIHCCDNTAIDKLDKMWKMRPFMDLAKERFGRYFREEQCLSFDESMISYFGRHGCKQFIRGKPIRFGYNVWCLNTSDSYLVNFDIYQGNNPRKVETYEKEFGKAAAPLVGMIDELQKKELPFRFYFDNYFTSYRLVNYLRERNYGATGAVRVNRIPKDCPVKSNKELAKMKRGNFDSRRCVRDNIAVVKWVDNVVVSAISSCHGVNPITGVGRFSKSEKKGFLCHDQMFSRNTIHSWEVQTEWIGIYPCTA